MIAAEAIILDTETTDVENAEVIELAYSDADGGGLQSWRFKPTRPPTWGALATHHILMSELEGLPPSARAFEMIPFGVPFWIGHNVDFDWKALGSPPGRRRICTLAMARKIWPMLDSHSLVAMTYFTRGATPETRKLVRDAHGAETDVRLCAQLFRFICELEGLTDFESAYAFSEEARVPTVWTFGKFKGQPIKAADRGYANWYRRTDDPDPYVVEALRRARLL